ncbi:MAG: phosphatase PAP2 family protein [bacterium]|nr:phosphatase PAP2 family protein [bacterium]
MNLTIFNLIHNLSGKNFLLDMTGIFFARFLVVILIGAGLILAFRKKGFPATLALLAAVGFSFLASFFVKNYFQTARPFEILGFTPLIFPANHFSFPSDNAAMAAGLIPLFWKENRKLRAFFITGLFLVGFGRIFVGVHWPVDILGGTVLGLISGLTVSSLYDILLTRWFDGAVRSS